MPRKNSSNNPDEKELRFKQKSGTRPWSPPKVSDLNGHRSDSGTNCMYAESSCVTTAGGCGCVGSAS